jgi:hypothetical protein
MMWSSHRFTRHARIRPGLAVALALLALVSAGARASAQTTTETAALRGRIDQRYEVLPLREGVVLRPRAPSGARSIEISDGAVALDGQSVTGAELRSRLGADADLILQITYLDAAQRAALFGVAGAPQLPAAAAPPEAPAAAEPPQPPAPPEPPDPPRRRRSGGGRDDRVRFGGSIQIGEDEKVPGDVVVIGGSAQIDGEVDGDVVVVGGSLTLGPKANITNDAVVVGGGLRRDPGARVGGRVEEVSVGGLDLTDIRMPRGPMGEWWRGPFRPTFSLISTFVRVGVLCLLVALMMMFARGYVDRVGVRAVAEPLKAGAIGLLAQLLFVPLLIITTVVFVVTIIGIPLLALIPFGILALMLFALAGFSAVASLVGGWLTRRFGWTEYGPIATTVLGVVLIAAPVLLARVVGLVGGPLGLLSMGLMIVGFLVEYAAWTVGMGAVALARFSRGEPSPGGAIVPTGGPVVA